MEPIEFWEEQHHRYAKKDWIDKPTLFAESVIKYFPKNGKVLDLGAGHGQDSRYFASFGYSVLCTDYSNAAHDYAKKKDRAKILEFQKLDLSDGKLPYKDNEFDVVYAHLSLHYFLFVFFSIYQIRKFILVF